MSTETTLTNSEIYRKRIIALAMMAFSPVLAFLPVIIGMVGGLFVKDCNESNCGWAVLPWFSLFTFPLAFVSAVAGLILFFAALRHPLTKSSSQADKVNRKFYFAWLAAVISPLISFVGIVAFSATTLVNCNDKGCTTTSTTTIPEILVITGVVAFAVSAIYLVVMAVQRKTKK
jgi:MFS family permease